MKKGGGRAPLSDFNRQTDRYATRRKREVYPASVSAPVDDAASSADHQAGRVDRWCAVPGRTWITWMVFTAIMSLLPSIDHGGWLRHFVDFLARTAGELKILPAALTSPSWTVAAAWVISLQVALLHLVSSHSLGPQPASGPCQGGSLLDSAWGADVCQIAGRFSLH